MLKIRLFLVLLLTAIIGAGSWYLFGRGRSGKEIRNVLLISIDTCRADHLSCYGHRRKTTPNIDAIAEEGILFENVITPAPLTLPAHSSMLTGTIPSYHGVHDNMDIKFGGSNVTLAGILKGNGFTTGAIVSAFVLDHQFGLDEGFHSYNDSFEEEHKAGNISERKGGEATSFALDWLQENKDENFFLFLHYYDPHVEYEPPAPFSSKFIENPYAGEIAYTDYCIGQVIKKLKELDLYDSTLLVITSDHGEALGDHNELTHGYFIYQSTLKVPLIFKVPGGPEGVRIVDTTGLIDIVPTICGLLEVPVPSQVHGKDLSRYFMEKTYSAEERYFYCESFVSTKYDCNHLLGVVGDRWKYIQTTRPELYDLVKDPRESNNLVTIEANRARILQSHLQHILEQTVRKAESDGKVELDEQARSRLESLGYVASSRVSEDFEFDQSKDDPKDVIDFHNSHARANNLISQERYVEAKNICQKLLSQRHNCFVVHLSMTKIALEQEDFAGALPHFYQAIKLKPDRYDIHNNLGIALTHLGKFEEAVKHHLKALEINPGHAETHNNLGRALREQGKLNEAISHYRQALKIKSDFAEAHYNLGIVFQSQGKLDEAISHFRLALGIKPDFADAHYNLGVMLITTDRLDGAITHFREAVRLKDDWPDALNNLAWILAVYENEGFYNSNDAVKFARRACQLTDFEHPQFLDTLSVACAAAGNFSEAIRIAEKALKICQDSGLEKIAEDLENRLGLYRNAQPYREYL